MHNWRSVTLRHFPLAASRFNLFAACSRASSQMPPPSLELHAPLGLQRSDYSRDFRSAKQGSRLVCTVAILRRPCPLWVKSRHSAATFVMSALPPKADIGSTCQDVRFVPKADILHCGRDCYSITSSARASSVGGISRPSALAVVRLMTRSNLVGCSTGISPGFVPRRILSTNSAARRNRSSKFGP